MANIAISYSHRDDALAARIRSAFLAHGLTVWMDEVEGDSVAAENISLPWGQAHWDIITAEFASADVIVVADTPNWRASRYCQDEYGYVRHYGKWVEFLPIDPADPDTDRLAPRIADIAAATHARRPVTSAHARLVTVARTGQAPRQSRFERLLHRSAEQDARLLLSSSPTESGVTVTEELSWYAQASLERGRQARKRLRRMATSATAILAVLALVGVGALFLARAGQRSAAASSARSQALELASRAGQEPDTVTARRLAEQASAQLKDNTTASAVNIASANDQRLRTLVAEPHGYFGAAWSPSAPVIVGYSRNELVAIDADTGATKATVTVPDEIQMGTVAVSADGATAVFAGRGNRNLHVAKLVDGQLTDLPFQGVSAVSTGNGTELWWATDDGALFRSTFNEVNNGATPARHALPSSALAIDVSADRGLLDYVGTDGYLRTIGYWDPTFPELGAVEFAAADYIGGASEQIAATVKRCGDNIYGSVVGRTGFQGSTKFTLVDGTLSTSVQRMYSGYTPVCNDDGTAWTTGTSLLGPRALVGDNRPILPHRDAVRSIAVTDPSNTRSAVLTDRGTLYLVPRERQITSQPAPGALALLPMSSGEFHLTERGDVVRAGTGEITGTVGTPFAPATASVLGENAMIISSDGLTRIDRDGHTSLAVSNRGNMEFNYLRAGADGSHFVAVLDDLVTLISADGARSRAVGLSGLEDRETLIDADIAPDGASLLVATNAGRIATVALDESTSSAPQFAATQFPGGIHTRVSYVPATGDIVIVPADGTVRLLDRQLDEKAAAFHGEAPDYLATASSWVLVSSPVRGTTIYDANSLVVQDQIATGAVSLSPQTVRLNITRPELVGLAVDGSDGEKTTRKSVPIFGVQP